MQRLGLSVEKFINVFLSANEYDSFLKRERLHNYLRESDMEKVKITIAELENDEAFLSSFGRQYLLSSKANIFLDEGASYTEALDLLNEAINITIPGFDEKKISSYLLTYDEIVIIDKIAIVYWKMGNMQKTIEILYNLKASSDGTYVDESEKARTYPMIIYHLTKYLGLSKRFDEAIPLCDEGARVCIKNNKLELLPYIVFNKACDLFEIGNTDPCKELFTQVYYSLKIGGRYKIAEYAKKIVMKDYGIII